jgi:hypothetical protein
MVRTALAAALLLGASAEVADHRDLHRARSKVPRAQWKGDGHGNMAEVLNAHLRKMFPHVRACAEWTVEELHELQAELLTARAPELDDIYSGSSDRRALLRGSLEEYRAHWAELREHAKAHPHMEEMLRDGQCHETVMWLVHHVPAPEQQTTFAKRAVPTLGAKKHECPAEGRLSKGAAALCQQYVDTYSCSDCHSGSGITAQDYDDLDGIIPEDPALPGVARQRRCDQNYAPACGACEGVGGPYWGDALKDFQPTNCEVLSTPDQVPEEKRIKPQFYEQAIVHQLGSDRLSRTQNANPKGLTLYSQIRSTLWYDFPLNGHSNGTSPDDGIAKLRHDSFYDDALYRHFDHGLVTEIHTQTRTEREANMTGPMVSLVHSLLGWGKNLGGCTCLADPVGVPVLSGMVDVAKHPHSAFMNDATYLGRINLGVEYDGFKLGDKGHGDMKAKRNMTVDHYSKWFLHVFMDADESSPTYGQPVRFYGPYSGFAVYVKIENKAPPAEVWDTACVDNGWGTHEFKPFHPCMGKKLSEYRCMNVEKTHPEVCQPFENGAGHGDAEVLRGGFGSVVLPLQQDLVV